MMNHAQILITLITSSLVLMACNSGTSSSSSSPSAKIPAFEANYCTATFIEDFQVIDFFDDPVFTAKKGDVFLVKDSPSSEIFNEYELYLPLTKGAFEFEVPDDQAESLLEFNCDIKNARAYMGTFADVTVYKDSLTQEASCEIPAGTVVSKNGGGFAYVEGLEDYSIYEIYTSLPEDICPNGGKYIRSIDVEYKDQIQIFVPLNFFMAVDEE